MNSQNEIWNQVKGSPDYQVSSFGNIKNKNNQLIPLKDYNGYCRVYLCQNGITKYYYVHRLVAESFELPKRKDQNTVDHIDGNPRNNHVSNLRWANQAEQEHNKGIRSNNTTGFQGVYFCKNRKKNPYQASIHIDSKKYHLGCFPTAEQASKAYQAKAKEIHGQFYRQIINNYGTMTINSYAS